MKRFRLSIVSPLLIATGVIAYSMMLGTYWLIHHELTPTTSLDETPNAYWFLFLLCLLAFANGYVRIKDFHPALNNRYALWLAATPWRLPQPLPLGPVQLVWQDLPFLAVLAALARFYLHFSGAEPLCAFLAGYVLTALATLLSTGQGKIAALLMFILPAAGLSIFSIGWISGVCVTAYVIVAFGLQRGLHKFPWKLLDRPIVSDPGWPATVLVTADPKPMVPVNMALFLSALLGWWTFCIAVNVDFILYPDISQKLAVFASLGGMVLALLRLLPYVMQTKPPLSVLGRLVTGHFLIPGYDVIFLGPLATAAMGILAGVVVVAVPYLPLGCALAVALIFLPALAVGPNISTWKLTGAYHMLRPNQLPQNAQRKGDIRINFSNRQSP